MFMVRGVSNVLGNSYNACANFCTKTMQKVNDVYHSYVNNLECRDITRSLVMSGAVLFIGGNEGSELDGLGFAALSGMTAVLLHLSFKMKNLGYHGMAFNYLNSAIITGGGVFLKYMIVQPHAKISK